MSSHDEKLNVSRMNDAANISFLFIAGEFSTKDKKTSISINGYNRKKVLPTRGAGISLTRNCLREHRKFPVSMQQSVKYAVIVSGMKKLLIVLKLNVMEKMKKHVTVVAAIQVGFAILGLIGALVVFLALSFARTQVMGDEVAETVLRVISVSLPLLIGFMATLGLIGGIGLFGFKPWARYLVIIVAALGCLNIPIGTLKGVYFLWVLLQNDTIKLFENQGAVPAGVNTI